MRGTITDAAPVEADATLLQLLLIVSDHLEVLAADLLDPVFDVLLELKVFRVRTEDLGEERPLRALQEVVTVGAMLDRKQGRVLRLLILQQGVCVQVGELDGLHGREEELQELLVLEFIGLMQLIEDFLDVSEIRGRRPSSVFQDFSEPIFVREFAHDCGFKTG